MTRALALTAAIALAAALTACSAPAPLAPAAADARGVTARGLIHIDDPATGYLLQALTAWSRTDVTKVTLRLFKKTSGSFVATGVSTDVLQAALEAPVSLNNLKLASEYKVVAEAFDASNARIDNQAQAGSDADCAVTFTTPAVVAATNGDTVDDGVITFVAPVKLMNKAFAGQARAGSGVAVTNGTVTSTTAPESF